MKARITFSLMVLSLAALSPAPIRDPRTDAEKPKYLGKVSEKDLVDNGQVPVLGSVPERTNADGTGPQETMRSDADGKATMNMENIGPVHSNPKAVRNLTHAEKVLQQEQAGSSGSWITAVIALLAGFGVFYGLRVWLEKNGPAPKTGFRPAAAKSSAGDR
jgi:hypothetical protein